MDINNRSSHWTCSMKKGVLTNFTKFTGKRMNKYEKRMNKKRINLSKYVDNVSFHDIIYHHHSYILDGRSIFQFTWSSSRICFFFFAFFSKMYSYLGSIVYIVFLRWLWTLIIKGATRVVRLKKVFLEILQNSQEITCARVSLLIKLQVWGLQLY